MGFFKKLSSVLLLVFVIFSCKQEQSQLAEIEEMRKDYWGSKEEDQAALKQKAIRLDSAYKVYVFDHPDDTLTPEFLWENASLHLNTLQNADQALVLLKQLYTKYPDHRHAPQAVYLSAHTFENTIMRNDLAQKHYQYLIDKYPDHPFAKQAAISIKYIGKDPSEMLNDILDSNKTSQDTVKVKP